MIALEMTEESRQMVEKALEEEAKAKETRERLKLSVQKLRKMPWWLKRSRECGSLHAFCHGSFLLVLCCCVLAQLSSLK